jgi:hypothetical protein
MKLPEKYKSSGNQAGFYKLEQYSLGYLIYVVLYCKFRLKVVKDTGFSINIIKSRYQICPSQKSKKITTSILFVSEHP